MKKAEDIKAYYFFDEAGDPQILGRRGVNLIEKGTASKTFMVGYLAVTDSKDHSIYYTPDNPLEAKKIDPV